MAKQDWHYLLFLLTSHHPKERLHRTIRIGFKRKSVFLCSRCTGTFLGILTIFIAKAFALRIPVEFFLPLISLLPLMATIDWFTQSAKLRESTNWLRVCSGFLVGNAQALILLLLLEGFFVKFFVALGIASIYVISIYLIAYKTKCLESYLNDINQL